MKLILALTKPRFFIPVHGEYKHLKKHAELALGTGIPRDRIVIGHIGSIIETTGAEMKIVGEAPAGRVLVDGLGVGDVGSVVLRDRKHLAQDGLIIVVIGFDRAENAFLSAYRRVNSKGELEIVAEYMAAPSIEGKTLIVADPMLATGQSLVLAYEELMSKGDPLHTHIVSAIVSHQGLDYVISKLPYDNCTFWVGAIDEELTAQSFIVPGLGDAGDLAYGIKE